MLYQLHTKFHPTFFWYETWSFHGGEE